MNINDFVKVFKHGDSIEFQKSIDFWQYAALDIQFKSNYATVDITFDSKTQKVYSLWVENHFGKAYYWVDSENQEDYYRDTNGIIKLEYQEDFMHKAEGLFFNQTFDERIMIPFEIDDPTFCVLAKKAHELDITFNEYIAQVLTDQLKLSTQ